MPMILKDRNIHSHDSEEKEMHMLKNIKKIFVHPWVAHLRSHNTSEKDMRMLGTLKTRHEHAENGQRQAEKSLGRERT